MTIKISTGLSNALLATGSLRSLLANGFLNIYAGTVPDSADDSLGAATLLRTISLNNTGAGINFSVTAANRVIAKATETWSGSSAVGGTATFFRHVVSGDDGTTSQTQYRIQGTAGVSGTDLVLAANPIVADALTTIDSYSMTLPGE